MKEVKYNGVTYRVGDKVLLVNKRPYAWNVGGKMDKYLGKVVTISEICNDVNFEIEEDDKKNVFNWVFRFSDIVKKVEGIKHFKSYPSNYTGVLNIKNGYVQEILDEEEKKYFEAVFKPFKDKIQYIIKKQFCNDKYYIYVKVDVDDSFAFPYFSKEADMYINMKHDKEYTLKELGLFEEE